MAKPGDPLQIRDTTEPSRAPGFVASCDPLPVGAPDFVAASWEPVLVGEDEESGAVGADLELTAQTLKELTVSGNYVEPSTPWAVVGAALLICFAVAIPTTFFGPGWFHTGFLVRGALIFLAITGNNLLRGRVVVDARLRAWRRLALAEQAPADPLDGFELLVAEKLAEDETIRFAAGRYRWSEPLEGIDSLTGRDAGHSGPNDGWYRAGSASFAAPVGVRTSWPADTSIEEISSAWADFNYAVAAANEARYREQQETLLEQTAAKSERAETARRTRRQLAETREIAELLPGPTVIKPQPHSQGK